MGKYFKKLLDFRRYKKRSETRVSHSSSYPVHRHWISPHKSGAGSPPIRGSVPYSKGSPGSGPQGPRRSGFLLKSFPDKETKRLLQDHYKSKTSERLSGLSKFPNGDVKNHCRSIVPGLFHGHPGPQRRLLPCAHPRKPSKVLKSGNKYELRALPFSVPGHALWVGNRTKGLHKDRHRDGRTYQRSPRNICSIFGRLPFSWQFPSQGRSSIGQSPGHSRKAGLADKRGQVGPSPLTGASVPGHHSGFQSPKVLPAHLKDRGNKKVNRATSIRPTNLHQEGHVPLRTNDGNDSRSHMGSDKEPTTPVADPRILGREQLQLRRPPSLIPRHHSVPKVVVGRKEPYRRKILEARKSKGSYYRRQWHRLGGSLGGSILSGQMGSRRRKEVLKLQRTPSGSTRVTGDKRAFKVPPRSGTVGQRYYRRVLEQTGRYQKRRIVRPVLPDLRPSRTIFPFPIGSLSKGRGKYSGRLLKSPDPPSGRLDPKQGNFPKNRETLGPPADRPFLLKGKSTGRAILFPKSVRPSLGGRRSSSPLEVGASLCLSPHSSNSEGSKESEGGSGRINFDSSFLAKKGLVFPAEGYVNRGPVGSARSQGPSVAGASSPSTGEEPPSHGLEVERQILTRKGFSSTVISTMLHSQKPITHKIYFKVWKVFQQFCGPSQNPESCSIAKVLDFLQAGLDKGLRPATLRVHIAALSSFLHKRLALDPWVIRFIRGAERVHPSVRIRVPPWNLSLVLEALTKPPFEPIEDIPIKFLSLKTAFLVAITTARRIGEISALVISPPYTTILDDRIILRPDPAFVPKVVSAFHRDQEIILPSFCEAASSPGERKFHSLDVRRAVIQYLQETASWRKSNSLFIQFSGAGKGEKASKSSLARWVKQAIQLAYLAAGTPVPAQLKAHSTRAVATSWAERQSASIDQICKAATWSSPCTFFRHYRLNISDPSGLAFGRKVLQAVVPP